jgi:4-coumarate--CoA ligase
MFGVLRVGGIVSGASPAYNVEEMSYALKTTDAKFLFAVPGSIAVAAAANKSAGIPQERVFLLEGTIKGFATMSELLEIGRLYGASD